MWLRMPNRSLHQARSTARRCRCTLPHPPTRAGEVIVQALVGPDGRPRQVEVVRSSSHGALDQAALRAVRQWRFEPAVRRGEVVAERVLIPITFSP